MYVLTVLSKKQSSIRSDHLLACHKLMVDNGDEQNANKIRELYKKLLESNVVFSFAGHFSAGKSSMINALLGQDVLPASPIPTSANIVEVSSGGGVARIFFNDEEPMEYQEPYDIETIKEYCKEKDTIQRIELSTSDRIIPENCAIIDTPGIDAADDADRLLTESSLHLVDTLFYVMDYNHVQSEVNLHFLKNIQDIGIPFYIIINQIDKHDETEITFLAFKDSVNQTFDQWNISPEETYFTSLIEASGENNQFSEVRNKLFTLLDKYPETSITGCIERSTRQIAGEHKQFLKQVYDEKTAAMTTDFSDVDEDTLTAIESKIAGIQRKPADIKKVFQTDLNTTLKNAYLMPADTRDKAALFLESQQRDFKVGFLAVKKKTSEEKAGRRDSFLKTLQTNIKASIQWKLRDKFIKLLKENSLEDPDLMHMVQHLAITYTSGDLLNLVKSGAKVNGDYVLNFTNDITTDIKQKYKDQARHLLEMILDVVEQEVCKKLTDYESERVELQNTINQKHRRDLIQTDFQEKIYNLDKQLLNPEVNKYVRELMQNRLEITHQKMKQAKPAFQLEKAENGNLRKENKKDDQLEIKSEYTIDHVIQSIDKTIHTIESLPGFQSFVDDLKEKKQRLNNRTLTIALFGAFSAGKSSFANALLGESLLPSSPNPTTAVINRILPVTEANRHGSVVIQFKDEETLVSDLISLSKQFSPPSKDFEGLLWWVQDKELNHSSNLNDMYQTYLQAIINGYKENKQHIGKKVTITIEDFAAYVTDESKSCYIEAIDLYYKCPLTTQGITLVDTPGADSINGRHTNVAFDYIKYADAILYVTYYNHALSRADRDFLMQLGRVKEAFQLDKMFFIINATDLAQKNSDLRLVVDYVDQQLLKLGIRFPKIFPVSSKRTLENKTNNQSLNDQMHHFETEFYQFVNNGLATLSIQSALLDINRAYQALSSYLETVNLNEKEKENKRYALFEQQEMLYTTIEKTEIHLYEVRFIQKMEKQLHYVEERLAIRFHDMFKETFNPTTVTESGKAGHDQLFVNLEKLLDYTGYELLQELRAVSLRMETFIHDLATDFYADINRKIRQIDKNLLLSSLDMIDLKTPEYEQAFINIDKRIFKKALSRYKGTKTFFEKNEKEMMKDEIYSILTPAITNYIKDNNPVMKTIYIEQLIYLLQSIKQQAISNIDHYVENNLSMMSETIDIAILHEKQRILSSIIGDGHEKDVEN